MSSILIGLFTLVLVIVCLLLVLVILMQRPNANSGMGAALGGGAAEGVFGGETGSILTKATVKLTVLFFVISAGLYFGYIYTHKSPDATAPQNLTITAVAPSADAAKAPAAEVQKKAEEKAPAATAAKPAAQK